MRSLGYSNGSQLYAYGMGDASNLEALAQAFDSGSINPSYDGSNSCQGIGGTWPIPGSYYVDDSTAARIASLLGASVEKLPLPDLSLNCAPIPPANYIRFNDGSVVNAAYIAQLSTVGANADVVGKICAREYQLAMVIPQVPISSDCTKAVLAAPPTGAVPLAPRQVGLPVGSSQYATGVVTADIPADTQGTDHAIATLQQTGSFNPASSQVSGSTIQPSPAVSNAAAASSTATTDWISIFTEASIGGVPNWVWMAGAAAALFAFSRGK